MQGWCRSCKGCAGHSYLNCFCGAMSCVSDLHLSVLTQLMSVRGAIRRYVVQLSVCALLLERLKTVIATLQR